MQSSFSVTQRFPVFTIHAICSLQTISYCRHFYAVPESSTFWNITLHSTLSVHWHSKAFCTVYHTLLNKDYNKSLFVRHSLLLVAMSFQAETFLCFSTPQVIKSAHRSQHWRSLRQSCHALEQAASCPLHHRINKSACCKPTNMFCVCLSVCLSVCQYSVCACNRRQSWRKPRVCCHASRMTT